MGSVPIPVSGSSWSPQRTAGGGQRGPGSIPVGSELPLIWKAALEQSLWDQGMTEKPKLGEGQVLWGPKGVGYPMSSPSSLQVNPQGEAMERKASEAKLVGQNPSSPPLA